MEGRNEATDHSKRVRFSDRSYNSKGRRALGGTGIVSIPIIAGCIQNNNAE